MTRPPAAVVRLVKLIAALLASPALLACALAARLSSRRRRRRGLPPRLVWGPVPIISIKYWSAAMTAYGYPSVTCVDDVYDINAASDFDRHRAEFGLRGILGEPFRDFVVFAWALRNADVFCFFFDGGFLRGTAMRSLECPLLRLAGKRILVSPYGSDIAVPGTLAVFEEAIAVDYPETAARADAVRRRVDHFSRWADVIVRNVQPGYLPRHDVIWPSQLGIDVDAWTPTSRQKTGDGVEGEVMIVHAPNHRALKGTQAVIDAVDAMRADGLRVRLELLERRPNEEVRAALIESDILAEQLLGGYGMLAVEGMAAGVPVVSRLSWLPAEIAEHPSIQACPIVDADMANVRTVLERLVRDPAERRRLGAASRAYAVGHHSYAAVAAEWAKLIDPLWATTRR